MPIPFAAAEVVTNTELNELARAHWRKTTAKVVANTITETDLLNGEITIDAGAMSTNRALRLTAWGDQINNTGGAVATPRYKLKLGATTIIDTNTLAASWGTAAGRYPWRIVAEILNLGATNSQWTHMEVAALMSTAASLVAAPTTGGGVNILQFVVSATGRAVGLFDNTTAVDTTAANALALTVTLATANALEDVTLKGAIVEVV